MSALPADPAMMFSILSLWKVVYLLLDGTDPFKYEEGKVMNDSFVDVGNRLGRGIFLLIKRLLLSRDAAGMVPVTKGRSDEEAPTQTDLCEAHTSTHPHTRAFAHLLTHSRSGCAGRGRGESPRVIPVSKLCGWGGTVPYGTDHYM